MNPVSAPIAGSTPAPTTQKPHAPATQEQPDSRNGDRRHARVAVLGASGYSGQEFARLSAAHSGLTLAVLSSREHAGRPASEVLAGLDPRANTMPVVTDPNALEGLARDGVFDTLIVALPHGAWKTLAAEKPGLAELPARIIDFSSDHRDGAAGYVYGMPEMGRAKIAAATRVANPGCYPTATTLALLPAAEHGWLAGPAMVSALSGVSGAGRSPALRTSFVELEGGASLYKVGTIHDHVREMNRNLSALAGVAVEVGFAPQLAPMARGILLTANAPLARPLTPEEAHAAYVERFADERFVRVLAPGEWPETRAVRSSNRADIAVTTLHGGRTLLVAAAIDNLVKGAAGQALQNLNLMLGWPEDWSLPIHGSPW